MAFCATFEREIRGLLETRLVQTNTVKRSLALRLGFAVVSRHVASPVHLVEVGASAGIILRFDRYGYRLGGRAFGEPLSQVQIDSTWRSTKPVPDLDAIPTLASVTGVDLHPLNAAEEEDRLWLEALVWPENRHEARLLDRALAIVAADPPAIRAGDAVDVCPSLAAELPTGEPRVVFHAATRIHVPEERRDLFDDAVASFAEDAPLWWLCLESDPPRWAGSRDCLSLRTSGGSSFRVATVDGHLEWVKPLDL